MSSKRDKELGMDRPITRRDFLQGAAIAVVATGLSPELAAAAEAERLAQNNPGYYPPTRLGMRGSHPGSFEAAHEVRDGDFWTHPEHLVDTGEDFDLIVVGGGISGLSAAHFYRDAHPEARILIIENHDDFGGHAKRNEFHVDGRVELLNGGTVAIDSPYPYSEVANGLLNKLGVYPVELAKTCNDPAIYGSRHLQPAVFFDKETFGADRLIAGEGPYQRTRTARALKAFLDQTPLSPAVRRDVMRIEMGEQDYLAGLTAAQKKDRLWRISYRDFLLNLVKADPGVIPYYQHRTDGLWGCGIDAVSALDCWGVGLPGFQGMKLPPTATNRMGYTPAGYSSTGGSYYFHFPDGNASIARLLVRSLIPEAIPGHSARDIVMARADYSKLNRPGSQVRILLNHVVVRARNIGASKASQGVEIAYTPSAGGGNVYRVRARNCVMASWNMMLPFICPEMPIRQKGALLKLIKTPLVYGSVALRNWTAFDKLGIRSVYAPGGYFSFIRLNSPVNIGRYRSPDDPSQPILVHMLRTPARPGLPEREQHIAGRKELLVTSLDTFERNIRGQLGRTLGTGGFDPARDIAGIAVNRWPHGYAPEYNSLCDIGYDANHTPNLVGRKRFGRITIANADSGMGAYTSVAIDQAHRAVEELLAL